jgi:hypothetical protein
MGKIILENTQTQKMPSGIGILRETMITARTSIAILLKDLPDDNIPA